MEQETMQWVNVIGISFDLVGAFVLAKGLFLSKEAAIELGISRACSESEESNLKIPAVADRLSQSRNAKIGGTLLAIGFLMQILANWPVCK